MPLPFEFDYKKPDYDRVYKWRIERLERIRSTPGAIDYLKLHYKDHPAAFINDWGMTFDPRNADIGLPTRIPFLLFPKQEEWVEWIILHWRMRKPGLTEKSREMGLSWLAIGLSCTLCLFYQGIAIGFGSRLAEYVDKIGNMKSIFQKGRMFLAEIPIEFRGGWDVKKHAPEMRLMFPQTSSTITGEGGDNIGRGDRTSIYFVDESAHLMRPQLIEASLSSTTNCRQDISTPNGMANPFAQKRFSGRIDVFTYDWHADPRKDNEWYEKQKNDLDSISLAQEIDINYAASMEGLVIEPDWIASSIDFAENLNIEPTGSIIGAFDVADGGVDLNAFGVRKGIKPTFLKSWSGKGSDIFASTDKVFLMADENNCAEWFYDADGLGAGVNGDAKVINDRRRTTGLRVHNVKMFRGSGEIVDPDKEMVKGRKNKDFFANHKAQAWWSLRFRFQETHRVKMAYTENKLAECKFNKDDLISLPSNIVGFDLSKLRIELTQPRYSLTTLGKIVIDKNPDGAKSPNLADCLMMLFAPVKVKPAGMFS